MIKLTQKILITGIKRKSKAKLFSNVETGDILLLSLELRETGNNRGVAYVPDITIRNLDKHEETFKSLNMTAKLLYDTFKFEEI